MAIQLTELHGDFRQGRIRDRPNRFVLEVEFEDGAVDSVYISNTGSWNVTKPGRSIIVRSATAPDRKTDYDAVFVEADGVWVSVDATFPNRSFRLAMEKAALPGFVDYQVVETEPSLPSGGRADFALETPDGEIALVEVKSCTLVEEGIAKFPDRPTTRGRRHLEELTRLREQGTETHVVFVIQREDGRWFEPNTQVDPEFARKLAKAASAGVGVDAMQLKIEPNTVYVNRPEVPIRLPEP